MAGSHSCNEMVNKPQDGNGGVYREWEIVMMGDVLNKKIMFILPTLNFPYPHTFTMAASPSLHAIAGLFRGINRWLGRIKKRFRDSEENRP